jgi:hypothetical protein
MRANYEQLRSDMIAAGYLTQQEFDQDVEGLGDSSFLMPSPSSGQLGVVGLSSRRAASHHYQEEQISKLT